MILKAVHAVLALLLGLSIAVQYNDPDPALWMALYALPLVFVAMGFFERYSPLAGALTMLYLPGAAWLMPWGNLEAAWGAGPQWRMMSPENETLREAGGLLFCAIALGVPFGCWWFLRASGEDREDILDAADMLD